MHLPIKATLVAYGGFSKAIKLKSGEIPEVIQVPIFKNGPIVNAMPMEGPEDIASRMITFKYEKHKQVCQNNGQPHIVVVYRQVGDL